MISWLRAKLCLVSKHNWEFTISLFRIQCLRLLKIFMEESSYVPCWGQYVPEMLIVVLQHFVSSTLCMVITSLQPGITPSPQAKSNVFFPMFILWDKCTGSFLLAKQILSCGCVQSTSYKLHRYACNRNESPYPILHKESATWLLLSPRIMSEFTVWADKVWLKDNS